MAVNRVKKINEEKKDVILSEFIPGHTVTLKGGEKIEYGQALSLDSSGKYIKYVAGTTTLPKTIYKGMDEVVDIASDTEILVVRSADVDFNLIKGLSKTDYEAIDNLEKYGINVVISRTSDINHPAAHRIRMANSSGADIALDLHVNEGAGRGFEAYVPLYRDAAQSRNLARPSILPSMTSTGTPSAMAASSSA